jgi:hypothetical protein
VGLGVIELVIILVIGLIFLAIPLATLVIGFLIYTRLDRIEKSMNQKD